jgi:hypothetical protein
LPAHSSAAFTLRADIRSRTRKSRAKGSPCPTWNEQIEARADDNWSHEETDNPPCANQRNFYKVENWSGGAKAADMKVIFAACLLSISLCCCAAQNDRSIYRNLIGPTVIGDGKSVLVSHAQNEAEGQRLAEKHCKRFGKSARFNRMEGVRAFFDCQSPS